MKRASITALTCVFVAACSVTPVPNTSGPVPLASGTAEAFTPLVAASGSAPSCVHPPSPSDSGMRAVGLRFSEPLARQVTVTVDATGDPIRYVDVRGDLSEGDETASDRTTIGLYIEQGYAVLSNREGDGAPDILEVPLDDLLTSTRLGNPSEVMQQVLSTCAEAM